MTTTTLPIYDSEGNEVGQYELDLDQLSAVISRQLLHDAVVMYQSNLRQGSVKTKNRGEVHGSKKKMYRQKGTGNARAGHKRSGVRRGGGHIFAKMPRNWYYRLPRKALQVATRMAVRTKIEDGRILIIDQLKVPTPKTKVVIGILKSLKINTSLLIAVEEYDVNTYKSARNIEGVKILPVAEINAYEILRKKQVLITKTAIAKLVG